MQPQPNTFKIISAPVEQAILKKDLNKPSFNVDRIISVKHSDMENIDERVATAMDSVIAASIK